MASMMMMRFFSLDLDLYQIHHPSIQQNHYDVAVKIVALKRKGGEVAVELINLST